MNILIGGYYGFNNLGDESILSGLSHALQDKGHRITVLSSDSSHTKTLHGLSATHRYRGLLPAMLQADAFICGGGGLLQDKTSSMSLEYYLMTLRLAKRLGKKVFVYAQSIGPLSDSGKKKLARVLKTIPVAVRDKASADLLESLGIESHLTADAALLLLSPKPIPVPEDAPVVLIPRHGYPEITEALIKIAQHCTQNQQNVVVMSVQPDEDKSELEHLKSKLPNLTIWQADTPTDFLEHISKAKYVFSARLHGLILAAVANRPFSGLVYDPKVLAFCQETDAIAHTLPIDNDILMQTAQHLPKPDKGKVVQLKERSSLGVDWLDIQLRG